MYKLISNCSLCAKRINLKSIYTSSIAPNVRFSTEANEGTSTTSSDKLGGFAKAFEKYTKTPDTESSDNNVSFPHLLRHSKFIDMGDPEGRIVTGTIFQVVNDDLYIDFGWKFHCVCPRPKKGGSDYVRGAKVRLKIKDLELSTKFLGSEKDLTLLEADAVLLGLQYSPAKKIN